LPARFARYFEPFAGGAALFFDLRPERAELTDINSELIDCYRAVRDRVEPVIVALGRHRCNATHYYRVRAIDPASLARPESAARTIYLNKTGAFIASTGPASSTSPWAGTRTHACATRRTFAPAPPP
jgi:DNA adenine methylase